MDKLGVSKDKYLNIVSDYGNMVSVAVPFGPAYALDHGYVKKGDTIFLMGTAAGMTVNMLALKTLMIDPLISSSKSIKSRWSLEGFLI